MVAPGAAGVSPRLSLAGVLPRLSFGPFPCDAAEALPSAVSGGSPFGLFHAYWARKWPVYRPFRAWAGRTIGVFPSRGIEQKETPVVGAVDPGSQWLPLPSSIADAIEVGRLPAMPQTLAQLLRVSESAGDAIEEVAGIVGEDPALCAHVLSAAASARLTRERRPDLLRHCVTELGLPLLRTMAECLAVQSVFGRGLGEQAVDLAGFWSHSRLVAELARAFAERLGREDREEAYLAGLLHDIGQLLLLDGLGARYAALLAWSRDEDFLISLERPELGTDHAAAGAALIDRWRLPAFVADAVLFHHRRADEIADADPLSRIVWAAHVASRWNAGEGQGFEASAIGSLIGLDAATVVALHREGVARVAERARFFGIAAASGAMVLPRSPQAAFEGLRAKGNGGEGEDIETVVREWALAEPLRRAVQAAASEAGALRAIGESLRTLTGLSRIAFLLAREDAARLVGVCTGVGEALVERLELPLEAGRSLAAAAALEGTAIAALEGETAERRMTLADVQIARALGSEGVLHVPMRSGERLLGVMSCGIGRAQHERVRERVPLMMRFARLAAASLIERRDASSREKRLEEELTSRFRQHAREIVHEAGNPLSIITNYLKIIADRLPDDAGVRREFGILREEIDRIGQIVRRIGDMTPKPPPRPDLVDVNAVIEGMAALYRESLFSSRGITLDLHLDRAMPAIPGSRDQIKQILLNLWKNAAEAMSAGGHVVVTTVADVRHAGRECVEIRVADNGPGLPADVIQRMFQPLDPQRRAGHAGMGLSIVAALVKGLGGQITFQTRAGEGTTFVVVLPRHAEGSGR